MGTLRRTATWIVVFLALTVWHEPGALAANNLIGHKTSATKYGGTPVVGQSYKLIAQAGQDGNPATFPLPTNPTVNGGLVSIARDAGFLADPLTAGTWKGLGSPVGMGGWK